MNKITQFFTVTLILVGTTVFAQETDKLSRKQTDSLINGICLNLRNTYFDSIKAFDLSNTLRQQLKQKRFYNIETDSLTKKLTSILRKSTNDIHFYVGKYEVSKKSDSIKVLPKINYNGGFVEIKILEHNIGYIKWNRCKQ